jgi:hypothetical protein
VGGTVTLNGAVPIDQGQCTVHTPSKAVVKLVETTLGYKQLSPSERSPCVEPPRGFAEHPGDVAVTVRQVVQNQLIRFERPQEGRGLTTVEMRFEKLSASSTLVAITEAGWRLRRGSFPPELMARLEGP